MSENKERCDGRPIMDIIADREAALWEPVTRNHSPEMQDFARRCYVVGFKSGFNKAMRDGGMIAWHDPEKKPESEKSQILVVKYPEREPWWIRAWWQDNQWYSCDDGVEVPDHYIVKWGFFELPEIEEVEG